MHNFTTEDLLQYLYKETTPEQSAAILQAIQTDWSLQERMVILKTSLTQLNEVEMVSPRLEVLEKIFNYAEKTVEELSEKA
jgi:hypothetical protein